MRARSGSAAPWLAPLFGEPMQAPSKNREEGRALALGGRRLMMANNYQPDSGRSGRGGVRAEARWAGSMWGDAITSYGASNGAAKKSI